MAVLAWPDGLVWSARLGPMTDLLAELPPAAEWASSPLPDEVVRAVLAYHLGHVDALTHVRLDMRGSRFTQSVLAAVREIPAGCTATYGDIAVELGRPGAARAVGMACGRSRFGLFVPCHRVVSTRGATAGGYAPGVQECLLAHEGVTLTT